MKRQVGENVALFGAGVSGLSFLAILTQLGRKGEIAYTWIPSLNISASFYVDGLSLLLGLLASGIGVLVFAYAREYMHGEKGLTRFYTALMAFLGSMLGLVFAGDLIMLFVFWEMTSLTSFMLIGHYRDSASSLYAARKSMAITVGGGLFLLVAFIMVGSASGTYSLAELLADPGAVQESLKSAGLYLPVIGFLTVGAAAKSAQVPLHIWLPDAMEAPTPVSAFLHSATMVKAGVFLLGRFRPVLVGEPWMMTLVPLGLLTMTVAGFLAVIATDIKGLLAYSTASHLGLIAAAFGFTSGTGAGTGAFHIFNHALFKASLFMVSGIVAHEAGTRKIEKLSGLRHQLPVTAGIATVAGLSMAGIPPFGGFQSKELLFKAAFHAAETAGGLMWMLPVVAVGGSVFTFLYSFRFISMFYGKETIETHSPSRTFLAAPALLAAAVLVTSLTSQSWIDVFVQPAVAAASTGYHLHAHILPSISVPLGMSALTILVGAGAFLRRETIVGRGRGMFERYPFLSADWWYDKTIEGAPALSGKLVDTVQHGRIRGYVSVATLTTALAGITGVLIGLKTVPTFGFVPDLAFALVLGVAGLSAFQITRTRSQVSGVLMLSIVGAMVAIFYVLADAPDLALTQVTVETLSLIIFMLVLDRLPSYYGEVSVSSKVRDTLIAGFVGASAFGAVMLATAANPDRIAGYFVEKSVPEGGGGNIVNVILVDFRGFDTMGEISVIAMAALAIVVLLSSRSRKIAGGDRE